MKKPVASKTVTVEYIEWADAVSSNNYHPWVDVDDLITTPPVQVTVGIVVAETDIAVTVAGSFERDHLVNGNLKKESSVGGTMCIPKGMIVRRITFGVRVDQ